MMDIVVVLLVWFAVSVPVTLFLGAVIAFGRGTDGPGGATPEPDREATGPAPVPHR